MCVDPVTAVAIIGGVASIAGAGVSAYGQYKSGKAQEQAAEYQAGIERKNAVIAQENANQERQVGVEQQRRQRIQTAQTIGMQKTAMAANGLSLADGTPLYTITDTAEMGEMDALMIGYDSERRAKNFEQQANNFNSQANFTSMYGANASKSGMYSAAATGLGGVGTVASKWSSYSKPSSISLPKSGTKTTIDYGYKGSLSGLA